MGVSVASDSPDPGPDRSHAGWRLCSAALGTSDQMGCRSCEWRPPASDSGSNDKIPKQKKGRVQTTLSGTFSGELCTPRFVVTWQSISIFCFQARGQPLPRAECSSPCRSVDEQTKLDHRGKPNKLVHSWHFKPGGKPTSLFTPLLWKPDRVGLLGKPMKTLSQ